MTIPTTEQVRKAYVHAYAPQRLVGPAAIADRAGPGDDFDTWLDNIRAEAWDKGYTSGHSRAMRRMSDEPNVEPAPNPYRKARA